MKLFTPAAVLSAALLPLAARAAIPLIDDLVKKESWSYVPVRPVVVGSRSALDRAAVLGCLTRGALGSSMVATCNPIH